ncbi:MAG TPA: DUF2608 domain-containing protein [Elusimicrobiales bacterium]|nr:DUF2608 domain-containing protein [Elusimicrobiales bacterium]
MLKNLLLAFLLLWAPLPALSAANRAPAYEISAATQTAVEAGSMSVMFAQADSLLKQGVKPLLVFDVDDTLLIYRYYLGTSMWFGQAMKEFSPLKASAPEKFERLGARLVEIFCAVP